MNREGELGKMTQTEARKRSAELNADPESKAVFVAAPVPLSCWGGRERGWAVYQILGQKYSWHEGTE